MKKMLVFFSILLISMPAIGAESIELKGITKEKVNLSKPVTKYQGSLLMKSVNIEEEIEKQRQKDAEDIENLWKGTVENNQVIGFALKKLASPDSQKRIHSSLMSKTLSAVISGSSFIPSLMRTDPILQTSSFAMGRLAQTLLNKKNIPQETPLTDTELIELAGLVETLQDKIIDAYYNYKSSLIMLKDTRTRLLLYNKNYIKALDDGDILDITIYSTLYENMTLQEFQIEQNAKKYHLELQRLAGKKAVDNLNLYFFNFDTTLVKGEG